MMDLLRLIHQSLQAAIGKAHAVAGDARPAGVPVGVWAGFSDLGQGQGLEMLHRLAEAGVDRVVFTPTNDATASTWKWQPSRARILRGMVAARDLGLDVWLGPWVRCDPDFMDRVGAELRALADDGGARGFELDAEGSFEVTARAMARQQGCSIADAVQQAVGAFVKHTRPGEDIGATVLYWRRPAGNALIRLPVVTECVVQAYSVWLRGGSRKAQSTHASAFQPGTLQDTAYANYVRFKADHSVQVLATGLGWWAQDRSGAPASMRITEAEGFRLASDACLHLGVDRVMGWACHLWDSGTGVEASNLDHVLAEIRYLTSGGGGHG